MAAAASLPRGHLKSVVSTGCSGRLWTMSSQAASPMSSSRARPSKKCEAEGGKEGNGGAVEEAGGEGAALALVEGADKVEEGRAAGPRLHEGRHQGRSSTFLFGRIWTQAELSMPGIYLGPVPICERRAEQGQTSTWVPPAEPLNASPVHQAMSRN